MSDRKENSTYSVNEKVMIDCDLTYAVNKIEGRWKILIIDKLAGSILRFSELKKELPNITERMLALQLRMLEKDRLVIRTVHAGVPPKVEYELTVMAQEFVPIFRQLSAWGAKHKYLDGNRTVDSAD